LESWHGNYSHLDDLAVIQGVGAGHRLPSLRDCHPQLWAVLQKCWSARPADRPPFAQLAVELAGIDAADPHQQPELVVTGGANPVVTSLQRLSVEEERVQLALERETLSKEHLQIENARRKMDEEERVKEERRKVEEERERVAKARLDQEERERVVKARHDQEERERVAKARQEQEERERVAKDRREQEERERVTKAHREQEEREARQRQVPKSYFCALYTLHSAALHRPYFSRISSIADLFARVGSFWSSFASFRGR
jgi:hypothetical protein